MSFRIKSYLVRIVVFFLFVSLAHADLNKQRQYFLDAEDAFKKGNQAKFNSLLKKLKGYPLYPYLVFMDLQKNLTIDREKEIVSFLSEYESCPLSGQLRKVWLSYLAGQKQWRRLVRDFREPAPPFLQYAYARALLETGEIDNAWNQAEKLWRYKGYLPGECYPAFDYFYAQRKLTSDLVWQRIELTMVQKQTALALYLKRYLPADEKPWVDLWVDVFNQPTKIFTIDWSNTDREVAARILGQAMDRLIRQDTPWAVWAFDTLKAKQDLSKLDLSKIEQEIALYLAFRRQPQALERIVRLPENLITLKLREWRIRVALFRQDWKEVLSAWDNLNVQEKTATRWLYWKARALAESGRFQEASTMYQEIVGQKDYFSLLAADRLNQTYRFNHRPLVAADEDISKLRHEPGIRRAVEFFYLERMPDARKEWIFSLKGKGLRQLSAAALMAYDMGWHDRAIRAAAAAGEYDDLIVNFPLSYSKVINRYAGKNGLDPGWIFALIRQESMFVADAKSPAGALGVMQIMPDTGKRIASHLAERFSNPSFLLSPEKNIKYGTCYLRMRLEDLQNNPVLASAAYNAGPRMVRRWLPQEGSMPADIWVEIIPFFETRNYIEKIFLNRAVYRQRLGLKPQRVFDQMPDVLSEKK